MNNCQEQNNEVFLINANVENKNDKGIQCDIDNETNIDAIDNHSIFDLTLALQMMN